MREGIMNDSEVSEVKVLLVDDDEEEYTVVRKYLKRAHTGQFRVKWIPEIEDALRAMAEESQDIALLDYHLGERTGIELLREMRARGHNIPVILLTGRGSLELDLQAMEMGAFDYLEKGELTSTLLERSIRYALENHRARVALQKANEELEQRVLERTAELHRSNRDLEQFADLVARDLQEPLRAINTQIEEILGKEPAGEAELERSPAFLVLERIALAARNMELMVQSVLNYSRVGSDTRPFETVDLSQIVAEVRAEFESRLGSADVTLEVGDLPSVQGERDLLKGLFENLLDNAVKFREERPLMVRIWSEQKKDFWLVAVRDNGVGISHEDLDDIFVMFHRGKEEPTQPGIGMGLTMCRKIVQYHGGRIWADSEPGTQSTFYFTLPVAKGLRE
jgi:light-regulated signal transduction histidine kinase (bacteriophytochrome)